MAYFGKEFTVEREENYDAFIKSLGLPEEMTKKYINYRPRVKLEKDGDSYAATSITPDGTKVVKFQSGVEFDDAVRPDLVVKTTYTVDGNVITQKINKDDKAVTFKREYSDNEMKVTITATFFDGAAYRYYKAL